MRLSDISIDRPVLATVMNLLIVVAGLASFRELPVREYPDVDNPIVSVTTLYSGASPEVVESTVTQPLEQVLNGIDGIRTIESQSSFGRSSIQIEFIAGRDVDLAANDVSNALQRALRSLPDDAERPTVRKAGANSQPIMWIEVRGESYSAEDLTDVADRLVRTPLQILPGVAQVIIAGERRYAMRVWLDPARLAFHAVDPRDVREAILDSNRQVAAGQLEAEARKFTIYANAKIDDPAVYERIVIREEGDQPIRIGDVGWVELGSENYQTITRFNRRPIVALGIVRQSNANELGVSAAVRGAFPEIRDSLPAGVEVEVAVDGTIFVEASLKEVWETLAIAFLVVVLVNLFFLRSLSATFITSVAIPISLIGTFAIMQALGFSVNVLTLLAMVLAIGIVVDDAIVVMENAYRRQELGEAPPVAARRGAREVGFAVIATTVSLVAVLIPLAVLQGNTGRLLREFALTVACAVSISGFVALSLVPMLCAGWLHVRERESALSSAIETSLRILSDGYGRALDWCLAHRRPVSAFCAATFAATWLLFVALPATFVPIEDRGTIFTAIRAPQGSTTAFTFQALEQIESALADIPEVRGFFSAVGLAVGGPGDTAEGFVVSRLRHWDERTVKQQDIVADLRSRFLAIPQAVVYPINPSSLGQARYADVEVMITSSSAPLRDFAALQDRILGEMAKQPNITNIGSDLRLDNPQLNIEFDRERASDVGVSVGRVAEGLKLLVSQGSADEFILRNRQYDVILALASRYRSVPDQLGEIHLRGRSGKMIPLSSLIRVMPSSGPATANHFDLQRSLKITANLAPGAALGTAIDDVRAIVDRGLPGEFSVTLSGLSREFVETGAQVLVAFGLSLLVVYLVLSAQFESFVHPITVLVSVPLAVLGALLSLWLTGNSMNLYSQIGIILLVGLVAKNAILLVDFANQARARGVELLDALRQAGRVRFRPILMTSATSIVGSIPLLVASGAGAESRHLIGLAVVGGLFFSTVFTLLVVPVVYVGIVRVAERLGLNTVPPALELDAELGA